MRVVSIKVVRGEGTTQHQHTCAVYTCMHVLASQTNLVVVLYILACKGSQKKTLVYNYPPL